MALRSWLVDVTILISVTYLILVLGMKIGYSGIIWEDRRIGIVRILYRIINKKMFRLDLTIHPQKYKNEEKKQLCKEK